MVMKRVKKISSNGSKPSFMSMGFYGVPLRRRMKMMISMNKVLTDKHVPEKRGIKSVVFGFSFS